MPTSIISRTEIATAPLPTSKRLPSVRALLFLLVLACMLPAMIVTGFLLHRSYQDGRAELQAQTLQTARAMLQAVDAELAQTRVLAQTLATSDLLERHDLVGFHHKALASLQGSNLGNAVVIFDIHGQQLVNTAIALGQPLPKPYNSYDSYNAAQIERLFASETPFIQGVFLNPLSGRPVTCIAVPVFSGAKVIFVLAIAIAPQKFNSMLSTQKLRHGSGIEIFDSTGTIAAGTHDPEKYIGHKGATSLLAYFQLAPEGIDEMANPEGIRTLVAYSRSPASGWSAAITMPVQDWGAPLVHALAMLGLGAALLLAAGGGLAWFIGGRIARSVQALMAPATALAAGQALLLSRVYFREAEEVAQAMLRSASLSLTKKSKFIDTVTDAAPIMISYWDAGLHCRFANAPFKAWFGRDPAEMQGVPLQDLLGKDAFLKRESHVRAALRGEPQQFQCAIVKPDGSDGHVSTNYLPDIIDGAVSGFYVMEYDITQVKLTELRLALLNEQLTLRASEADAANRAKTDFISNLGHELRMPMKAVIDFACLHEQAALPGDASTLVRNIGSAARSLLAVINDVLDFSKIEARHIVIEHAHFRLSDVLDHVHSIIAPGATDKKLTLRVTPPGCGIDGLRGDALRLQQVLLNLLGNGVKFTARGQVELNVGVIAESPQNVTLRFAVRDSGIGIAPDRQEAIFDSFSQKDGSTMRRFGGSGLGLTTSRGLVELMGGQMGVASLPGSGSEFWFTLEFGREQAPGAAVDVAAGPPGQRLKGLRLLVVDDSDINRQVVRSIFAGEGAHVVLANDGRHALDWLQAHPDEVDLVLMDVQMPVMDGYQATRLIRATPELAGLPVIALTAGAFSEEKDAAKDAGMSGFITKSFDLDEAIALIRRQTAGGVPGDPAADLPGLAVAAGLALWKDAAVYRQYLRKFAQHYAASVSDMAPAGPAAAALAHKLAGAAGSLALQQVAAQAKEACRVLRAGDNPAAALALLQAALDTALESIGHYAPAEAAALPV